LSCEPFGEIGESGFMGATDWFGPDPAENLCLDADAEAADANNCSNRSADQTEHQTKKAERQEQKCTHDDAYRNDGYNRGELQRAKRLRGLLDSDGHA
jgi:hypothetical protein